MLPTLCANTWLAFLVTSSDVRLWKVTHRCPRPLRCLLPKGAAQGGRHSTQGKRCRYSRCGAVAQGNGAEIEKGSQVTGRQRW